MKRFTPHFIGILLIGFILTMACKDNEPEKEAFIRAPFPELNPEYTEYKLTAEEGGIFSFETGTQITVPPNIWQNAEGQAVSGDITLRYREFHNAADIFLSGSSLAYDSAGVRETFTTAGMFEIRAVKDSSEIFIKDGGKLTVKMASFKSDNDFNFYNLDEEDGNWEFAGRTEPEVNPMLREIRDTISKLEKTEIISTKENKMFALNYDAIVDIYFNNRRIDRNSKAPKRKAQKYGLTYSGIYGAHSMFFRGRRYEIWEMVWELENAKRLASWTKSAYVNEIINLGNNRYYMKVKSGEKQTTYKVKAVMPLKVLFATAPEKWQEEYEQVLQRLEEEQQRFEMQAAVYRTFDVNTTGFHNWDKIYETEDRFFVKSDYKFDKEIDTELGNYDIFYFVDNNQSFVRYKMRQGDTIHVTPDSSSRLVAVLSHNEAAVCPILKDVKDFNLLKEKGAHTFNMKTVKINSKEDFMSVLE